MINIFWHEHNPYPIERLMASVDDASKFIRPILYQDVLRSFRFPTGTAIFTDMEYLSPLQMDAAVGIERALLTHAPDTRILNRPSQSCERFHLLRRLQKAGLSDVETIRIDSGEVPTRYPVFIRSETGCYGPDTELLNNQEEFEQAVADLHLRNLAIKGRISVSYEAEPNPNGEFQKYGVLRIGDHIVPQHLMFSKQWMIKAGSMEIDPVAVAEELEFIFENPHQAQLMKIFDLGGIQYGRADYGIKDGKLVIYEINVNPTLPASKNVSKERAPRRAKVRAGVNGAFRALDNGDRSRSWLWLHPIPDAYRLLEMSTWSRSAKLRWRLQKHLAKRDARRTLRKETL